MPLSLPLSGKRILIFVGDIYEDLELWYPKLRLHRGRGPGGGGRSEGRATIRGQARLSLRVRCRDCRHGRPTISTAWSCPAASCPTSCAAIANVLQLVRDFADARQAGRRDLPRRLDSHFGRRLQGVRVTGSPGIKDDLVNAGAIWEDAPVVVDRHFVSQPQARRPARLLPGNFAGAVEIICP